MQVFNRVGLLPKKGENFASGQNSVYRPLAESKPNGCNFVKGQHFVNSVETVLNPTQEGMNSAKGRNCRKSFFCKIPDYRPKF